MNTVHTDDGPLPSPQALIAGMDESCRNLYHQICGLDHGTLLLRFLHSNANTVHTVEDIAFHIKQAPAVVEKSLHRLVELGWARRLDLPGLTWFGLTADAQRQSVIRELFAWQDRWHARLEQIRMAIDGTGLPA